MATSVVIVPAGTTTAPIPVTPLMSILAGPALLGGTTTLAFSATQSGPFTPWSFGASSGPQSFRPAVNGWIQVTAATAITNVAIADMNPTNSSTFSLMSANCTFASASSTSEQVIGSIRVPPGYLPLNGCLDFSGSVSMVNGVGTKTLQLRVGGIGGTLVYQSGALASNANVNFRTRVALRGDGITQAGFGSGLTNIGYGLSTTAYTSYTTLNYQQNEIEYVLTCTKGTAGDLMQMEQFLVQLLA